MSSSIKIRSLDDKDLEIKKIGIIYNVEHKEASKAVEDIERILKKYDLEYVTRQICPEGKCSEQFSKDIDLALIVGGDGTFLGAARYYAPLRIPLFGINMGRLGFLAQLKPNDIEYGLDKLFKGEFKIEERLMIKAFDNQENPKFNHTALNDLVIKGGSVSRTAQLFLYIDGRHVCDYLADGLIISTPTGSTAYTLSAGGPVVVPELDAIVIVPICPHSLTTRPIVIPANEEILVKVKTDSEFIYLTSDGQENTKVSSNDEIHVLQSQHKAKLILLKKENNGFYSILREKLHWGVSPGEY